jgi:two-component system sensor histidine kinase PilS (NtrC family)
MHDRGAAGELASEVRALILVRLLVLSVLGVAMLWAHHAGSLEVSPGPVLGLLGGAWGLTLLYWMGLRVGVSLGSLVAVQIALDLVIETILVTGTGGTSSPLVLLYFLTTFTAGAFLFRRGALLTAASAGAAFAGVAWFVGEGGARLSPARAGYEIGVHAGALLLLAHLSALLAERSQKSRERLESAEEELERVSVRTDRVLENMPIGVITGAKDGRVVRANRAAREMLSLPEGQGLPGDDLIALLDDLSPALPDALESILATRKWAHREEVLLRRGSEQRSIGVSVVPLDDETESVIVTLTDVGEIRRMEREMRRSEQLATLGELAAGVAHEIRNPLASISGAAQVLRSEVKGTGEDAELMDLIVSESDRLNRIIDGVLDYTRDHSGSRSAHDLAATAREVVRMLLHDKRLTLGKTILVEFPETQDFRAEVEEGGMKQVFYNLARNALEAMGVGGILRITGESGGDGVLHVVFRDTGTGIPAHELEHIFKPFHTSKPGGTGMGLSIASRIVEGNGGSIRAKSTPGLGTAFTIELPAAVRQSFAAPPRPKEEEAPSGRTEDRAQVESNPAEDRVEARARI